MIQYYDFGGQLFCIAQFYGNVLDFLFKFNNLDYPETYLVYNLWVNKSLYSVQPYKLV
jgi:hypothetical protein